MLRELSSLNFWHCLTPYSAASAAQIFYELVEEYKASFLLLDMSRNLLIQCMCPFIRAVMWAFSSPIFVQVFKRYLRRQESLNFLEPMLSEKMLLMPWPSSRCHVLLSSTLQAFNENRTTHLLDNAQLGMI